MWPLWKVVWQPQEGCEPQVESHCFRASRRWQVVILESWGLNVHPVGFGLKMLISAPYICGFELRSHCNLECLRSHCVAESRQEFEVIPLPQPPKHWDYGMLGFQTLPTLPSSWLWFGGQQRVWVHWLPRCRGLGWGWIKVPDLDATLGLWTCDLALGWI